MEASTRRIVFDFNRLIVKDSNYVIHQKNSGGAFYIGPTFDDMVRTYRDETGDHNLEVDLNSDYDVGLDTDDLKALVYVSDRIYHFLVDTIPLILRIHNLYPGITFVLYPEKSSDDVDSNIFYKALFDFLDKLGSNYFVVKSVEGNQYSNVHKIRNFINTDRFKFDYHDALTLRNVEDGILALKRMYLGDYKTVEPFRKVYIKREYTYKRLGSVYQDDLSYPDDLRMHEEERVASFFASAGYEIVSPEKDFKTLAEQIKFMSEVKVLAAVSSSALANELFMEPGQRVIEIMAEVCLPGPSGPDGLMRTIQKLPTEYPPLSFLMQHTHVSIPTPRDPTLAIQRLNAIGI